MAAICVRVLLSRVDLRDDSGGCGND